MLSKNKNKHANRKEGFVRFFGRRCLNFCKKLQKSRQKIDEEEAYDATQLKIYTHEKPIPRAHILCEISQDLLHPWKKSQICRHHEFANRIDKN